MDKSNQYEFLFITRSQPGKSNGNWKGGRSKENYYYRERARKKFPEKHNARNKVYRAVKSGKLKREPCEVCGDPKSEAHHYRGYEFPLDVQWLCRKHHIEAEKIKDRFN